VQTIVEHLRRREAITVAEARDLFGTSRRYVLPVLEQLDRERVTRRRGDERILGPQATAAG
jgi:selenocysteine-specific elongation factor